MPLWTRKTITPGDRVTVEIPYSHRRALRPLIGLLRTVEVIDGGRAVIINEDGTRYGVNGKTVPPVALVEVSIVTDRATGGLWAHVYDLPPREHGPYPVHPRYAPVAQPDRQGGIAWMPSCWCGKGMCMPHLRRADDHRPDDQRLGVVEPIAHRRQTLATLVRPVVLQIHRTARTVGLAAMLRAADDARARRLGVSPRIRTPAPLPLAQPHHRQQVADSSPHPRPLIVDSVAG